VDRARGSERPWKCFPLDARPEHEEDGVHRLPVVHPRAPGSVLVLWRGREERLDLPP
jgi:hypothetical protein